MEYRAAKNATFAKRGLAKKQATHLLYSQLLIQDSLCIV